MRNTQPNTHLPPDNVAQVTFAAGLPFLQREDQMQGYKETRNESPRVQGWAMAVDRPLHILPE